MMKVEEKIQNLQLVEHSLNQLLLQKQTFQAQLAELESAQAELHKTDLAYKIVGNVMVKADRVALEAELKDKAEVLALRIKNIERQESAEREKAERLRKEVLEELKAREAMGGKEK